MRKVLGTLILTLAVSGGANALDIGPIHIVVPPHHPHGPSMAPEIDPASAMGGLTLLIGGLAVVRGRRSSK